MQIYFMYYFKFTLKYYLGQSKIPIKNYIYGTLLSLSVIWSPHLFNYGFTNAEQHGLCNMLHKGFCTLSGFAEVFTVQVRQVRFSPLPNHITSCIKHLWPFHTHGWLNLCSNCFSSSFEKKQNWVSRANTEYNRNSRNGDTPAVEVATKVNVGRLIIERVEEKKKSLFQMLYIVIAYKELKRLDIFPLYTEHHL